MNIYEQLKLQHAGLEEGKPGTTCVKIWFDSPYTAAYRLHLEAQADHLGIQGILAVNQAVDDQSAKVVLLISNTVNTATAAEAFIRMHNQKLQGASLEDLKYYSRHVAPATSMAVSADGSNGVMHSGDRET